MRKYLTLSREERRKTPETPNRPKFVCWEKKKKKAPTFNYIRKLPKW